MAIQMPAPLPIWIVSIKGLRVGLKLDARRCISASLFCNGLGIESNTIQKSIGDDLYEYMNRRRIQPEDEDVLSHMEARRICINAARLNKEKGKLC